MGVVHECHISSIDTCMSSKPTARSSHNNGLGRKQQNMSKRIQLLSTWHIALVGLSLLRFNALITVEAHGWLELPAARNYLAKGVNNFWEPMSLNR